ncbi:YceH family protein [Solitalea sp. MAHUQ-68]|uniref:YceH family protein n=1 Tax=Solitalea agri TaxID=2953739 RepID=A0A9X2F0E5_9SPHI|nr:YceH family protein [Solitalea agri]MCO4292397.1 YceH family protein [Solitalea agri]
MESQTLPLLDAVEQRVLGALIEKSRTTPEYYPLTLNSLAAACNQKSARKPVVNFDDDTIVEALNTLKKKGLVSTATGGSSRTIKYKHNLGIVFPIVPAEVSIICLLLLRGPQTPGELNTNSGRMYEYESLEEIQEILEKLSNPELQFVVQLPKRIGQKEARYMHLLGGTPSIEEEDEPDMPIASKPVAELEARLEKVETELAELKEAFDKLMKELMG